jgi:hypothetical protein
VEDEVGEDEVLVFVLEFVLDDEVSERGIAISDNRVEDEATCAIERVTRPDRANCCKTSASSR